MLTYLINIDHHLFKMINGYHNHFFDLFFSIYTNFGSALVVVPILLLLLTLRKHPYQTKRVVIICLSILSLCGIINSSIKQLVHRPRPLVYFENSKPQTIDNVVGNCQLKKNYEVHVLGQKLHRRSFPSGHTNTAFATATLLVLVFGGYFWLSYIPALLVGYSRIYVGAHFPVDVLGGALVGTCFVILLFILCKKVGLLKYRELSENV